jgi:hypothetical protein
LGKGEKLRSPGGDKSEPERATLVNPSIMKVGRRYHRANSGKMRRA